jgi:GNAT superfamily N-acetyltransferase
MDKGTRMSCVIRDALPTEYDAIGALTVRVYQQLPGMPDAQVMPEYYRMLANVSDRLTHPSVRLLAAVAADGSVAGTVTYYNDMRHYGSGGSAPQEAGAAGCRLLAVDPAMRGHGLGRRLTEYCMQLAKDAGYSQMILHSTRAMQQAWDMYQRMGFTHSPDLDFMQGPLPVFGFRKQLSPVHP